MSRIPGDHPLRMKRALLSLEGLSVGGIVFLSAGLDSIPSSWRANREPLPF